VIIVTSEGDGPAEQPLRSARLLRLASDALDAENCVWISRRSRRMTSDAPRQLTCPRCGTDAGGAAWCPKCGLNLRRAPDVPVEPRIAPPPPAAAAPVSSAPAPRRSNLVAIAAVVAAVAVAAGAAVVIALQLGRSESSPSAQPPVATETVTAIPPAAATPAPATEPVLEPAAASVVTAADMEGVLLRYETAYSNEDLTELGSLFADDLIRRNGADPPEDLFQALETYSSQFSVLSNPLYTLSNVSYVPGLDEGAATGVYEITHDAGTVGGEISFHFTLSEDQLLIDALEIEPYG
jgi:hypothetical protein